MGVSGRIRLARRLRPEACETPPPGDLLLYIRDRTDERFEVDQKVGLAEYVADFLQKFLDLGIDENVLRPRVEEHLAVDAAIQHDRRSSVPIRRHHPKIRTPPLAAAVKRDDVHRRRRGELRKIPLP